LEAQRSAVLSEESEAEPIEAVPKLAAYAFGFVLPKNTGTLFEKMRNLSLRHCVQPQLGV
jgi:hypothetical protein